ncbi:MAG: hypothetical protein EBR88_00020 [Betaproteobacteria bacterium]|nr:hypothetical protein [Betaproteobacteria bacterium]
MCLAIYKPADTLPDWESYANGFRRNDDSWGFAAVKDGALVIERGLHSFGEFRAAFEPYSDCQAIIHFRYATHGDVDLDNAHPFLVSEDLAVIHNGIIDIECGTKGKSDTWHFVQGVLKVLNEGDPEFYAKPHILSAMGTSIGGNKLVFLRANGDYAICNEQQGETVADGHWYSNTGYRWFGGYSWWLKDSSPKKASSIWSHPCDAPDMTTADLMGLADDVAVAEHDEEYEYEDDDAHTHLRRLDLQAYGFSNECLDEVFHLLGHGGLEALHDAL